MSSNRFKAYLTAMNTELPVEGLLLLCKSFSQDDHPFYYLIIYIIS
jgi:hypothetical protein